MTARHGQDTRTAAGLCCSCALLRPVCRAGTHTRIQHQSSPTPNPSRRKQLKVEAVVWSRHHRHAGKLASLPLDAQHLLWLCPVQRPLGGHENGVKSSSPPFPLYVRVRFFSCPTAPDFRMMAAAVRLLAVAGACAVAVKALAVPCSPHRPGWQCSPELGVWDGASSLPTLPDRLLPHSPSVGNGYLGALLAVNRWVAPTAVPTQQGGRLPRRIAFPPSICGSAAMPCGVCPGR